MKAAMASVDSKQTIATPQVERSHAEAHGNCPMGMVFAYAEEPVSTSSILGLLLSGNSHGYAESSYAASDVATPQAIP